MHHQSCVFDDMNNNDISSYKRGSLMPFAHKTLFMVTDSIMDKYSYPDESFGIDELDLDLQNPLLSQQTKNTTTCTSESFDMVS